MECCIHPDSTVIESSLVPPSLLPLPPSPLPLPPPPPPPPGDVSVCHPPVESTPKPSEVQCSEQQSAQSSLPHRRCRGDSIREGELRLSVGSHSRTFLDGTMPSYRAIYCLWVKPHQRRSMGFMFITKHNCLHVREMRCVFGTPLFHCVSGNHSQLTRYQVYTNIRTYIS